MRNKILSVIVFLTILTVSSCKKYLDIVPSDIATLDDAFENASNATKFLATLYSYIPEINMPIYGSPDAWGSDEIAIPWTRTSYYSYELVTAGALSSSNTLWNDWKSMYSGIRYCWTMIANVDNTPGLADSTKKRFKGEAYFLAGYFHFVLLREYGPICTIDHEVDINSTGSDYYPSRQTYDSSVNFIAGLLDTAASMLPSTLTTSSEYGRVTSVVAKSIKARMLLYAASPLFNGNATYYSSFTNSDGKQLVNQTYDATKWTKAADACLDAINAASSAGVSLYTTAPTTGSDDAEQYALDYRYAIIDPWNKELIWGYSNGGEPYYGYQRSALPNTDGSGSAYNGVSPTIKILETYYTENGLPIDKDPSYDYDERYTISGSTFKLNLNREPRYYASIAYQGGIYYGDASEVTMNFLSGGAEGWKSGQNNYAPSGFLVQKMTHPESIVTSSNSSVVSYPWPVVRLSELYLSYAEALNEAEGTTAQATVLQYVNAIRQRSGIPTVQAAWALTGKTSFSQSDMQDIIRQERLIELAFEGHRCWDLRRWMLGDEYLNVPVYGMTISATTLANFVTTKQIESRTFTTPKSYLFPISTSELSNNKNLVQNPGW